MNERPNSTYPLTASDVASHDVPSVLWTAQHLWRRGLKPPALALYAVAIEADGSPASRYALAMAWRTHGDYSAAIRELEEAWDIARRIASAEWRARCCHQLANLHQRLGESDRACRYRQWALRAEMDVAGGVDPRAWYRDRIEEAVENVQPDQAREWLQRLTQSMPTAAEWGPDLEFSRGAVAVIDGNQRKGLHHLNHACREFHRRQERLGCARCLLLMGQVHLTLSHWKRAQSCFKVAEKLFTNAGAEGQGHRAGRLARECRRVCLLLHGDALEN